MAKADVLGIMPGSTDKGSASEPHEAMKALESSPAADLEGDRRKASTSAHQTRTRVRVITLDVDDQAVILSAS